MCNDWWVVFYIVVFFSILFIRIQTSFMSVIEWRKTWSNGVKVTAVNKKEPFRSTFHKHTFLSIPIRQFFQNYKHTEIPKCFKHFMTIIFRQVNTSSWKRQILFWIISLSPLTVFKWLKKTYLIIIYKCKCHTIWAKKNRTF